MPEIFKSPFIERLLIVLAVFILLVALFTAGISIGERKSRHFSGLCENYREMLNPHRGPKGPPPFLAPMLPGTHGVFGKVLTVSGSVIVVQGQDDVEQNVLITSSTQIRIGRDSAMAEDIRPGDDASVFGAPTSTGHIEARLIRIFRQP